FFSHNLSPPLEFLSFRRPCRRIQPFTPWGAAAGMRPLRLTKKQAFFYRFRRRKMPVVLVKTGNKSARPLKRERRRHSRRNATRSVIHPAHLRWPNFHFCHDSTCRLSPHPPIFIFYSRAFPARPQTAFAMPACRCAALPPPFFQCGKFSFG